MHKWQKWANETKTNLLNMDTHDGEVFSHYRRNYPIVIKLPDWNSLNWSLERLKQITGDVQVQVNRNSNPKYEIESKYHRGNMPFNKFIEGLENGDNNDLYMTAQNKCMNGEVLDELYSDMLPLPSFLTYEHKSGFFWIGKNTTTPLHHDLTNNLMCQVMGTKLIRVCPPSEFEKIEYNVGVHSHIRWLTEELIINQKIKTHDYYIQPGDALLLPVGWWHCVKSFGISITIVYTNFIWNNSTFHLNFDN